MQRRLLVLDDDAQVARTISHIAEDQGFEVRVASGPVPFFAAIDSGWPTHLAIDLVMPGMDGVEVLRSLAQRRCAARIIVTSGMGAKVLESARRGAAERGLCIAGILPKPFKAQSLRDLLALSGPVACPGVATCAEPATRGLTVSASDLDTALQQDQFVLHYQPKVRLDDHRVVGFEALVRWEHPRIGLVSPHQFIGVAEQTGRVAPLTYRIFEMGLAWLATCPAPSLSLAFNLSASSLGDLGLADRLMASCNSNGIEPARVSLELTETSAMTDPAAALDVLTRLRIKGFSLSIDDFGTGYSSMLQLARLPFSEIKIDRSFVQSMLGSDESRKIVDSILNLGRTLGLTTVAEGVETEATRQLLREHGCDVAQGYLFGRPMSGEDALHWLSGRVIAVASSGIAATADVMGGL